MTVTTAPSTQDYYDLGRAVLQRRNPRLNVVPGDATDAILYGTATMASQITAFAANRFLATFLDGAFGDDLTALARDRGVNRDTGDNAVGNVTFTRPTSSAGAGTIPAGTRIATQPSPVDGSFSIFTTDRDAVFSGVDLGPHTVPATCTKIGVAGNVAAGTATRNLDIGSLWDQTLLVTNAQQFAGGAEQESDDVLRDRVRGFFLTQARGTIDALTFGAKTVAGVKRATVLPDYATGIVTVYVSDADGNGNAAMALAVQNELQLHWADAGDVINVIAATIVIEAIDVSLTVKTGVDISSLLDRVRQAIIARVARLAPQETLYRDMISAAVRDVDREAILSAVVNAPGANVTPGVGQIIRTNSSSVTFT
jgi:uncharacterized phage protein gp47/JayE